MSTSRSSRFPTSAAETYPEVVYSAPSYGPGPAAYQPDFSNDKERPMGVQAATRTQSNIALSQLRSRQLKEVSEQYNSDQKSKRDAVSKGESVLISGAGDTGFLGKSMIEKLDILIGPTSSRTDLGKASSIVLGWLDELRSNSAKSSTDSSKARGVFGQDGDDDEFENRGKYPKEGTLDMKAAETVLMRLFVMYSFKGAGERIRENKFCELCRDLNTGSERMVGAPPSKLRSVDTPFKSMEAARIYRSQASQSRIGLTLREFVEGIQLMAVSSFSDAPSADAAYGRLIMHHASPLSIGLTSDALGGGDRRQLADPELDDLYRSKAKPLREVFLYYAGLEEGLGFTRDSLDLTRKQSWREVVNEHDSINSEEFLRFSREFDIMPSLLTKKEVMVIFSECNLSDRSDNRIATLNWLEFSEALTRAALMAFSKPLFGDTYPSPKSKLAALFDRMDNSAGMAKLESLSLVENRTSSTRAKGLSADSGPGGYSGHIAQGSRKPKYSLRRGDLKTGETSTWYDDRTVAPLNVSELLTEEQTDQLSALFSNYCVGENAGNESQLSSTGWHTLIRNSGLLGDSLSRLDASLIYVRALRDYEEEIKLRSKPSSPGGNSEPRCRSPDSTNGVSRSSGSRGALDGQRVTKRSFLHGVCRLAEKMCKSQVGELEYEDADAEKQKTFLTSMLDYVIGDHLISQAGARTSSSNVENLLANDLMDDTVLQAYRRHHRSLKKVFEYYSSLQQGESRMSPSGHTSPLKWKEVEQKNLTISVGEFNRFCTDFSFCPQLMSLKEVQDVYRAANVGNFADKEAGEMCFSEFEEAIGILALTLYSRPPLSTKFAMKNGGDRVDAILRRGGIDNWDALNRKLQSLDMWSFVNMTQGPRGGSRKGFRGDFTGR